MSRERTQGKLPEDNTYRCIDLFAGIGGIRLGFENAFGEALETVFVSEFDKYAVKSYAANFSSPDIPVCGISPMNESPYLYGDITEVPADIIPSFDICLAGFPCQAFSFAGSKQGFDDNLHGRTRGTLFREVVRVCERHKPKVIFCENVRGLVVHDGGRTFEVIRNSFEKLGYKVFYEVLNSQDYGLAQSRERIYIVCFRDDIAPDKFIFPQPHIYSVGGIGSNSKPCIGDILEDAPIPSKYYISQKYLDALKEHRRRQQSRGHGFGYVIHDWSDTARTLTSSKSGREGNMIIDSRKHSTIPTTNITGPINNEDARFLTPREFARLQGFPDDYKIVVSDTQAYKQFGNSVSVPVIAEIATSIFECLNKI